MTTRSAVRRGLIHLGAMKEEVLVALTVSTTIMAGSAASPT